MVHQFQKNQGQPLILHLQTLKQVATEKDVPKSSNAFFFSAEQFFLFILNSSAQIIVCIIVHDSAYTYRDTEPPQAASELGQSQIFI